MVACRLAPFFILCFLPGVISAEEQESPRPTKDVTVFQEEEAVFQEDVYRLEKPSIEVRRAVRLLHSSKENDQRRGRNQLLLLGPAVAPQLRYWIRGLRENSAKVEDVLAVIEGDGGRSARLSYHLEQFFNDKFRAASSLKDRGEYQRAQRIASALLTLDPSQPGAWELRRFVSECARRIAAKELLEPSFVVERLVYEVGELPELVFRIRNHNHARARIHLEKGMLGRARVTMDVYSANGVSRRVEQQVMVRAAAPGDLIVIGPGRTWEQKVPLNLGEPLPLSGMVARVQVTGRFRPTRWTTGDKNDNLSLSLPRTEFWIVPTGQSTLGDRPLQKLTAALLFDREAAFFVGGQLAVWVGQDDPIYNGKLVETLVAHLDTLSGPRLAGALRFLEQATGMGFGSEPEKWQRWWGSWHVADGGTAGSVEHEPAVEGEAPARAPSRR